MTDLIMCYVFLYFRERSSSKVEEYERLLPKGTSFAKQANSGQPCTKRCKYMYFDHMVLPPPKIQDHATCSNYSPMTSSNEEEDTDE
jgi:hypothetical protein